MADPRPLTVELREPGDGPDRPARPVYRSVILVTMSMFSGYASLVTLQGKLRAQLGIPDDPTDARSQFYTASVSFLYLGNLIFRMAHNVFFACFNPRWRAYVAMVCMILANLALILGVYAVEHPSIYWVPVAYFFGGIGIGSFESNILASIGHLGQDTKVWAITGLPLGFNIVTILGFAMMGAGLPPWGVHIYVLIMCGFSMVVLSCCIPKEDVLLAPSPLGAPGEPNRARSASSQARFRESLRAPKEWMPQVGANAIALMFDMFVVSIATAIVLYIFDERSCSAFSHEDQCPAECDWAHGRCSGPKAIVPLFSPSAQDGASIPHDLYFSLQNIFVFFGDTLSRPFAYRIRVPLAGYLALSAVGVGLLWSKLGILVPLGMFMIFFANGGIYASTTKHISETVPYEHSLMALSFWLFVGDIGSVTGSNTVGIFRELICPSQMPHVCLSYTK